MAAGMNGVAARGVGMVGGSFVLPGFVMPGGFGVVVGRMRQVFRGFLVVFGGLF